MNYRVIAIVSAVALAAIGIAFIVSFIANNRDSASDEVERVITLAPTSPAEDYAVRIAQLKRKAAKRQRGLESPEYEAAPTRHEHETVEDSFSSVASDPNVGDVPEPQAMDSELMAEFEALDSEYQAALSSASPEEAAMMESIRSRVESMSVEEILNTDFEVLINQYLDK